MLRYILKCGLSEVSHTAICGRRNGSRHPHPPGGGGAGLPPCQGLWLERDSARSRAGGPKRGVFNPSLRVRPTVGLAAALRAHEPSWKSQHGSRSVFPGE